MPISLLQTCFVEMSIQEKEKTKVQLVPDELEMFQKTTMAIFFFTHVTLTYKNESSLDEGIHLVLRMKRIITSEMMTTYLPTALLLLITYSTTFFKPCFFEAALSVNLTTMLVMTTIFISKMESLPQTSYMKMIDIWLILCQLAPFAQVVIVTSMEYFRKDDYDGHQMRMVSENKRSLRLDSALRRWEKVIARRRRRENTIGSPYSVCSFWVRRNFNKAIFHRLSWDIQMCPIYVT